MKVLNKDILIYGDCNYVHAVNYQHLYNAPITLNYGDKHNRKKYILSAGTCDHITLMQDGIFIYVIAENTGLNYLSMQTINTETNEIEDNIFLQGDDLSQEDSPFYNLLDESPEYQIRRIFEFAY
jgi:hypothetical protein